MTTIDVGAPVESDQFSLTAGLEQIFGRGDGTRSGSIDPVAFRDGQWPAG